MVGLELAEFLIPRGREVTVLEPTDKPGRELPDRAPRALARA